MAAPRKTATSASARKTPAKKTPPKAASTVTAKAAAKPARAPAARARLATAQGFRGSVEASLAALNLGPRDAAAMHLARAYAEALDRGRTVADRDARLADVGPKLLATLGQLGGTPRARKGIEGRPAPPAADDAEDLAETGTDPGTGASEPEAPPRRNRVHRLRDARRARRDP